VCAHGPGICRIYNKRVPRIVLETRALDEWVRVYKINELKDGPPLTFWQRVWMYIKVGFRTSVRVLGRARNSCTLST
jgi:hypothetical protein